MKIAIEILIMLTCLIVLIQDAKDRLISVALFVVAMVLLAADFYLYNSLDENVLMLVSNYLFTIAQTGLLYVYFVHIRKMPVFFDVVMGWGDLVMMGCMALVFPLPYFILFLMFSYFTGIVFSLVANIGQAGPPKTIPLAGIMGLLYVLNLLLFYSTGIVALQTFTL